jgi:hypothetical protein
MWWMLLVSFALWIPSVAVVSRVHNTMPLLWGTMIFQVGVLCMGSVIRWKRGNWQKIVLSPEAAGETSFQAIPSPDPSLT